MTEHTSNIDGVVLTSLKMIEVPGGNVLHAIKCNDPGYSGFGEAYFSTVKPTAVKGWKRHRNMTLNLIVPVGVVRFVIYDDRKLSESCGKYQENILSRNNYCRLTIPPMLWVGFQGVGHAENILLNIADIEHTLDEVDRIKLNEIKYDWEIIK